MHDSGNGSTGRQVFYDASFTQHDQELHCAVHSASWPGKLWNLVCNLSEFFVFIYFTDLDDNLISIKLSMKSIEVFSSNEEHEQKRARNLSPR